MAELKRDQSQLEAQTDLLDKAVAELSSVTAELESRLCTVLTTAPPLGEGVNETVEEDLVSAASRVRAQRYGVERQTAILTDILGRLQN